MGHLYKEETGTEEARKQEMRGGRTEYGIWKDQWRGCAYICADIENIFLFLTMYSSYMISYVGNVELIILFY